MSPANFALSGSVPSGTVTGTAHVAFPLPSTVAAQVFAPSASVTVSPIGDAASAVSSKKCAEC